MSTVEAEKYVVHRSWRKSFPLIVRGDGIYLYDEDGNRYIDAAAGSSVVVNIGHGVQAVVDAMYEQGKKVSFAAPHLFTNEHQLKLSQMVAERAPGTMRDNCRTWFGTTGTDAVDSAVRVVRQYFLAQGKPSKYVVIGRWQGFHGNNIAVSGIHGHTARRKTYYPLFVSMPHIPPAYCYRCPFELSYPECGLKCARELESMINRIGEENVAAFIAEPVVGAALGAVPAPDGYFQVIREICDRHDVLFISDEVMTGWGRTGYWFGIEEWGVTPDIIATAKGMTSGYVAISATTAKEEIWQTIESTQVPFLAGHTMNQNPVACAGAIVAIQYLEDEGLLANSIETGAYLLDRMKELVDEFEIVGDVRGKGLMCGFEFVKDKATKEPFDPALQVSKRYEMECLNHGVSTFMCTGCVEGVAGDMILVTPPLIITPEQVDELMGLMKSALRVLQAELLG
ncbi:aspartate aminotransferase family protein [Chloroflexota bacterium]